MVSVQESHACRKCYGPEIVSFELNCDVKQSPRYIMSSLNSLTSMNVVLQRDLACCTEYSYTNNQRFILHLEL